MSVYSNIRDLISAAKLDEALKLLRILAGENEDARDKIILLSARYKEIKNKKIRGIDGKEDEIALSKVIFSALEVTNDLEIKQISENPKYESTVETKELKEVIFQQKDRIDYYKERIEESIDSNKENSLLFSLSWTGWLIAIYFLIDRFLIPSPGTPNYLSAYNKFHFSFYSISSVIILLTIFYRKVKSTIPEFLVYAIALFCSLAWLIIGFYDNENFATYLFSIFCSLAISILTLWLVVKSIANENLQRLIKNPKSIWALFSVLLIASASFKYLDIKIRQEEDMVLENFVYSGYEVLRIDNTSRDSLEWNIVSDTIISKQSKMHPKTFVRLFFENKNNFNLKVKDVCLTSRNNYVMINNNCHREKRDEFENFYQDFPTKKKIYLRESIIGKEITGFTQTNGYTFSLNLNDFKVGSIIVLVCEISTIDKKSKSIEIQIPVME